MIISEVITEAAVTILGKEKGKMVRKYRCTSGSRKGRIVSSPATCNAPKRIKSAVSLKKAKFRKGANMKVRSSRTKRADPTSQRVKRLNTTRLKPTKRSGKKIK